MKKCFNINKLQQHKNVTLILVNHFKEDYLIQHGKKIILKRKINIKIKKINSNQVIKYRKIKEIIAVVVKIKRTMML